MLKTTYGRRCLKGCKMRGKTLLIVSIVIMFAVAGTAYVAGVEVGDWVKYDVSCEGQPHLWNMPLLYYSSMDVEWAKAEVLSVSGSNVTVRETVHRFNGEERNTTFTISPAKTMPLSDRYVIPANVSVEYKFPINRDTYDPITESWKTVHELSINTTTSRSYGGVTREVNILESSWMYPYFEYIDNLTEVYVWDRTTGFLLEKKWQSTFIGFGNASLSTVSLRIIDTNLWKMEATKPNQWLLWVAVGIVLSAVVVATTALTRNYKNRRKRMRRRKGGEITD